MRWRERVRQLDDDQKRERDEKEAIGTRSAVATDERQHAEHERECDACLGHRE